MSYIRLAQDLREVSTARQFVYERCRDARIDAEACDAAVLLTSEVVTNAFTHGRSEARLSVHAEDNVVRVEVGDDNARLPRPADDLPDALDGRGLRLVEALASTWGVREVALGKVVWFEIDC